MRVLNKNLNAQHPQYQNYKYAHYLFFAGSIAEPPGGTIFILIVLIVFALLSGKLFSLARLPPLLGMLLTGIVIKNIPGMTFDQYWTRTSR